MYTGQVVETAAVEPLFADPLHPYTQGLLHSLPRVPASGQPHAALTPITGVVPSLAALPRGCTFHPRCPRAFDRCRVEEPPLLAHDTRSVRCWLYA